MKVNNKSKLLAVLITVVMVTALFTITSISASAMNIYIQLDVELSDDITYALDVEPNENIGNIKRMIYEETGIAIADQTLIFAGKILENDKALSDYNIQKNSTVHLYVDYFEPAVVEFVGYQVNLGGDISMKYYVKSHEAAVMQEMIWVKVDFLGQTTEIRESTYVAEQDAYVFTFDGINPQCLGDDIDAELYIFETKQDEKLDYSVEDNLNGIYDEADVKTKQLIDDLRAYGKAAEAYTGRASMDGDYAVREIPVPVSSISLEDSSGKVSLHSVSVRTGSLNYMILKFSFDEGVPHELDVKIHEKAIADAYLDGKFYVVVSEPISPEDFHQKMHITYNEDFIYDDGLINALVSINDYCAEILKDTKGDEGNYDAKTESIAQALYNYGLSAHIVKGNHKGGDGTETCTHGKACEVCGEYYGAINPDNHASDAYTYTDNYKQSTHIKVHECGVVIDDGEKHTFVDGECICGSGQVQMGAITIYPWETSDGEREEGVFNSGDQIKVENYYRVENNSAVFVSDGLGNWTASDSVLWNASYNNAFVAWYPTSAYYETFTIPTVQNSKELLAAADWMTASTDDVTKPIDSKLNLTFYHRLAKLTVVIRSDSVGGTIANATIYSKDGALVAIIPFDNQNGSYTAIVNPATYTADDTFFSVTVGEKTYNVSSEDLTLSAGVHTTVTVLLTEDGKAHLVCADKCAEFIDGRCSLCGFDCYHVFDSQTGKCSSCEKFIAAASVTTADASPDVTYFQDLSTACLSATNGSTVTMLKHNSSKNLEFSADNITLDLNGFSTNAYISNIASNVTVKGDGYVNGQVSLQAGGCLTILGGHYQNVTVAGGEITVYGGTFKAIYISNRYYTSLYEILPEGYSFYDKNGDVIGEDQISESGLYYYYSQTLTVRKTADTSDK